MNLRTLLLVGLLGAVAVTLVAALLTREGAGAVEWIVGVALVVLLVAAALRITRGAFQRS